MRVPVGRRLGDRLRRDHAGGAGAVLHHHRLAERLERLGQNARQQIDAAAGREAGDDADRSATDRPAREQRRARSGDGRQGSRRAT